MSTDVVRPGYRPSRVAGIVEFAKNRAPAAYREILATSSQSDKSETERKRS